jgi:hypothetical protein
MLGDIPQTDVQGDSLCEAVKTPPTKNANYKLALFTHFKLLSD